MRLATASALLTLGLLAGCGDEPSTAEDPAGRSGAAAEPQVTCGSLSWPVSAMDGGIEGAIAESEVRAAFADLLEKAPMDAPEAVREQGADGAPYVVLAAGTDDGRDLVQLGVGPWSAASGPGEGAHALALERGDGGWEANSWGDCQLSVALPMGRAQVELTAPEGGVDGAATAPTVLANERDCTSGRDPGPFLGEPQVVETADRVVVTMASEAAKGAQNCVGNPSVPVELHLAEPIGDRELVDGGVWPPRPITVR